MVKTSLHPETTKQERAEEDAALDQIHQAHEGESRLRGAANQQVLWSLWSNRARTSAPRLLLPSMHGLGVLVVSSATSQKS